VANQWASEGAVLEVAAQHGVPVTQVQHGVLEHYYARAPIYGERFLVWGDFWQHAVRAPERAKVQVVNPGFKSTPPQKRRAGDGRRVTFFTAPLEIHRTWNAAVARWEVTHLLHTLRARGYRITIRVHPADRIADWQDAWRDLEGGVEGVRFDKDGSLASVLQETDLGLMFLSTVFLDCITSGIPMVALSWYQHMWLAPLEQAGVIHCARSIEHALELADHLTAPAASGHRFPVERFLAPAAPALKPQASQARA
jgi:hypothetical protein